MYQTTNKFVALLGLSFTMLAAILLAVVISATPVSESYPTPLPQSRLNQAHNPSRLSPIFTQPVANADTPNVELSRADLILLRDKLQIGASLLDAFWRNTVNGAGGNYARPNIQVFVEPTRTACSNEPVSPGNCVYCPRDHTIYLDPIFLARYMKGIGQRLGTDGDMAPIYVLAHEWGHSIQAMTGIGSNLGRNNELQADCLAGAFTQALARAGNLEDGDVDEAELMTSGLGDDLPWYDSRTHGTGQDRLQSFKIGFRRGLQGCRVP